MKTPLEWIALKTHCPNNKLVVTKRFIEQDIADIQWDARTDLLAKLEQATKENDCLRAITAKIMPCHYCGVDNISKCPQGFPGCALMDDVTVAGDTMVQEYRKLKTYCEKLEALERQDARKVTR